MIDRSDVEAMRKLLAAMCRKPEYRAHAPSLGIDRQRWRPFEVREQATLSHFTDEGAWECTAECLESGSPIRYKGPCAEFNDHAYVLIDQTSGLEDIYIKIALIDGIRKVIGISFHYVSY